MLQAIIDFFRNLFGRGGETGIDATGNLVRSADDARAMRKESLAIVDRANAGTISCPFHNEAGASLQFNNATNSFHCSSCDRSGSVGTLRARLQSSDAYRETIE